MDTTLKPSTGKTRILAPDVIRGFALFGVLLVNLTMMDATIGESLPHYTTLTGLNAAVSFFVHFFAQAKFYTIFSFLFGFGFFLFCDKPKELRPEYFFKRRLYALLLFGALHLTFVWCGDILHTYAICGFIMLSRVQKPNFNPKRSILILLTCSVLLMALLTSAVSTDNTQTITSQYKIAYQSYDYLKMVQFRVTNELPLILLNLPIVILRILGLFFLGYWVGKERIFQNLKTHHQTIKKICFVAMCGFILTIAIEIFLTTSNGNWILSFIKALSNELSSLLGATFYITALIMALSKPWLKTFVSPLQYTGRMALTNYLTQTVVFTTFFYAYGFGYFQKLPIYAYLPIAIGFYLIQLIFSWLWLKNHTFGPMEKLWRKLTYGTLKS